MNKPMICTDCHNECDILCAAAKQLHKIYAEMRTKEKRQLIYRLRAQLDIIDAEPDKDLHELAKKIIKRMPELSCITDFSIKIGYVRSYERKINNGKTVFADCRKVNKIYGAYLPFDFIITFYDPNTAILNENQLKILMWHELRHIGIGERGFVVEPHDIEDFYTITDAHGTRWNEYGADVPDILEG